LKQIIDHIVLESKVSKELKTLVDVNRFVFENDLLYYIESSSKHESRRIKRLCIPKSMHNDIFEQCHSSLVSGHLGFEKSWRKIAAEYFYPGLYNHFVAFFNNCQQCLLNKNHRKFNSDLLSVEANEFMEIIQIDHIIVDVESNDGHKFKLVATDVFTRKS